MKRYYEFKCGNCNLVFDEYCEYTQTHDCPSCGATADKIISATRSKLEGITGSFPSASWAWEKRHETKTTKE